MKIWFENKRVKIGLAVLALLGAVLITLHFVEKIQPNAYKKLIDSTLTAVQETTPDVVYESEIINGHTVILYVPVDSQGHPNDLIYKEMVELKELQKNQIAVKDSVTILYAKQDMSLSDLKIYHIIQDDYRYYQGEYRKNTSKLSNTLIEKNGQILTLWEMMNSAQFEAQVFAEALKTSIRNSVLDVTVKNQLLGLVTKEKLNTFKMVYTPEELRFKMELPNKQPYYVSIDPVAVVPYFNINYIYDSYKEKYKEAIEKAKEKQLTYQQEFAKNLQQKLLQREIGMKVALTFDDGPRSGLTTKVLDLLAKYDAKATFYILGRSIAGNEEILKRQVAEGHELGNHSWTHDNLTKISQEQLHHEIHHTQEVIKNITGVTPKTLRVPYGAYDANVAHVANMPLVNWNVDSNDWRQRNVRSNVNTVISQVTPGSIILMHDIHPESVDAVEEIIVRLKQKGYQFVTVTELIGEQNLLANMIYFGHNDVKSIE